MYTASDVACSHSMSWVRYCKFSSLVSRSLLASCCLLARTQSVASVVPACIGDGARRGDDLRSRTRIGVIDPPSSYCFAPVRCFALGNPSLIEFFLQTRRRADKPRTTECDA